MDKLIRIIAVLGILSSVSCSKNYKSETKPLMNTYVEIKIPENSDIEMAKIWDNARKLTLKFNIHDPKSELAKINKLSAKQKIKPSIETLGLIKKSLEFSEKSNGAFDPTVYPLVSLWNKYAKNKDIPKNSEIKTALKAVGYKNIRLDSGYIYITNKETRIDLGGIAKGYIIDKLAEMLMSENVEYGLINAGGDIRVFGKRKWSIGIQHPRIQNKIIATISISNKAAATSGDYERFFIKDSKRYHHIFDPKTGYPSQMAISATVFADDAMTADALATILCVTGHKKGFEILKKFPGTEALIIDNEGNIHLTEGLKKKIKVRKISLTSA